MKTQKIILVAGLLLTTALVSFAIPPSKRTDFSAPLRTTEDFAAIKAGDKLALVCMRDIAFDETKVFFADGALRARCKQDLQVCHGAS